MAGEDGAQARALNEQTQALFAELSEAPYRFGFYQVVRRLDCLNPELPATGTSFRPSDDVVRFSQDPFVEFAPSTLSEVDTSYSPRPRLAQRFIGLFGPDGPLPIHLTEYARDRLRQKRDPTIARFADLFHHRMISLYYRAWASAQPTVNLDDESRDRFTAVVGSLIGVGSPSLRRSEDMHYVSKLSFAGHLGSLPRHPAGLEDLLEGYFEVPVKIEEFVAHWLRIPTQDHLRLGSGLTGRLGQDTVIGERVWQRQDKFRVCLGPLSLEQYSAFLPNGRSFKALAEAVLNYVGPELLWEMNLILDHDEKPVTCLGKSGALGWTSWLESKAATEDVDDLMLQVQNYLH